MNRMKMKHYFNLALTVFVMSATASTLFASELVSGYDDSTDPVDKTETAAIHAVIPKTPPNALVEKLLPKDCGDIQYEIGDEINKVLAKRRLLGRATSDMFSFEHDLLLNKEQTHTIAQEIANAYDVKIPKEVEITSGYGLRKYIAQSIKSECKR